MAIAEVLTFPTGGTGASDLSAVVARVTSEIGAMTPTEGLHWCAKLRASVDAIEAALLARVVIDDGGDDTRASRLARRKGTSKQESRKRARRGKAVAVNPALGDHLANGSMSGEELDLLADAAGKSDDDALFDRRLVKRLRAAGPDQGKRIVRDWLHDRDDATTANEKYERQRRMRHSRRWDTRDGLAAITMFGDDATIDAAWNRALADADRMYREDGGRDVAASQHSRTHDQRMFDALSTRLLGQDVTSRGSGKPTVVVTVTLDKLAGKDPDACAIQIGTGPIADAVLAKHLAHGDLVGMLFDTRGHPLWLGRKRRPASTAQHLALTIRDNGCVLCAAPPNQCQAHHRMPWHAPGRGRTDIDQLVLLCGSCHRQVHQEKVTVYRDERKGCWTTRAASPNEIPPEKPAVIQRE